MSGATASAIAIRAREPEKSMPLIVRPGTVNGAVLDPPCTSSL